jgi:hypothetical protein
MTQVAAVISAIVTELWAAQYLALSGNRKFRQAARHVTQDNQGV